MKISVATVAVWLAFAPVEQPPLPSPPPVKCCGKCGGTGMVVVNDPNLGGNVKVWCQCPATCVCAKNRPKPTHCTSGTCKKVTP